MATATRTPWQVTRAAWGALLLREALARITAGRAAWMWMILEPVAHAVVMAVLFGIIRARVVPGADTVVWLLVGLAAFFTVRNTYTRGMEAINANRALFAYRQLWPVDTVWARALLEGALGMVVFVVLLGGAGFIGREVWPHDPLESLVAMAAFWSLGVGLALIFSVGATLVPEVGNIVRILSTPLYLASGVIIPLAKVPSPYREWAFVNPFAHGVELVRAGFFPAHHVADEASLGYLAMWALGTLTLGLALHVRFRWKLRAL